MTGRQPLALLLASGWLLGTSLLGEPLPPPGPAQALVVEMERLAEGKSLWPGFVPETIPVAIFDGTDTHLFRHPDPPEGFTAAGPGHVYAGRHPAVTANSFADIGGVATATVLLEAAPVAAELRRLAATGLHEAFHAFQSVHFPSWGGNEVDLFTYPFEKAELLALRRLESGALRRAQLAGSEPERICWTRQALALRQERAATMAPEHIAYERGIELAEGIATYVEWKALDEPAPPLPAAGFPAETVRDRAYATGLAWAVLLDQLTTDWQPELTQPGTTLDGLLAGALTGIEGKTCALAPAGIREQEQHAREDVASLLEERAMLLDRFDAAEGWRLVIETAEDSPLWPASFDPKNLQLVPNGVLHTRFLRLSNAAGSVQVLGLTALTEGTGPHPLFDGITRLAIHGLTRRPEWTREADEIRIESPELELELRQTTMTVEGQQITLRLSAPGPTE